MKSNLKRVCLVLMCLFTVTTYGASWAWNGGGDKTSWSDVKNWGSANTTVPLTQTATDAVTINASTGTVTVNLDAATADTMLDGTNANFLSTRASANANLILNADWGNGFTDGAMWAGQSIGANGTVTFNHNAGTLTLQGSQSYFGRGSALGSSLVYNVNGGKLSLREFSLGARTDALGSSTLKVNNAIFELTGVRFNSTAYSAGAISLFEISGASNVFVKEWRNVSSVLALSSGTSEVRVVGSQSAIAFDDNFYAYSDTTAGTTAAGIVKFVADASGFSPITAYDTAAKLWLSTKAILNVDLTAYTGDYSSKMELFKFTANNGVQFGTVNIIGNSSASVVYDFAGGSIYVIPEPATLVMLGLGAFGLIKRKRS